MLVIAVPRYPVWESGGKRQEREEESSAHRCDLLQATGGVQIDRLEEGGGKEQDHLSGED